MTQSGLLTLSASGFLPSPPAAVWTLGGTLEILPSHPQFISRSRHQMDNGTKRRLRVREAVLPHSKFAIIHGGHFLPLQREINQIDRSNGGAT